MLLGILTGLLLCIRPNSVVLALPVAWSCRWDWRYWVGAVAGALPQLLVWHLTFGHPWPSMAQFNAAPGNLLKPWVAILQQWQVFTSPDWGIVWNMPVFLIGLAGLIWQRHRVGLILVGISLYVVGAYNASWVTQSAYGWRLLICCLPAIGLGVAHVAERFPRAVAALSVGLILQQYLFVAAYKILLPYNHPRFSLEVLTTMPTFPRSSSLLAFLSAKGPWTGELMVVPIITLTVVMFIIGGVCAGICDYALLQRESKD